MPGIDYLESNRKIAHIIVGVILAALVYAGWLSWWIVLIALIIGIIISMIFMHYDIPVIGWFLRVFERPHFIKRFPARGVIYLFIGLLVVTALFDKNIAAAAVLIWAFGDSVSALIGRYGNIKHPLNNERLIEGTLAGIVVATLASSLLVGLGKAFVASLITLSLESLELKFLKDTLDDNLMVPVIAALILYLI